MNHLGLLFPIFFLLITCTYPFPQFVARFPNGDAAMRPDSGITCDHLGHENCIPGAPRNPFGQDFDDNGQQWDKALCEKDSDGDGLTNGEELGDPCCEWTPDNLIPLRQDQLSHPGEINDDAAKSAPPCTRNASPTPSSAGTTPPTTAGPTTAGPTTAAPTTAAPTTTSSTATPTPTGDGDDDNGVCFPAHSTVQLENGSIKRMDQLEIGDRVHIGRGKYSDVFLFTHKISDATHEFVTIRAGTADKLEASITLTKGHFIYTNGKLVTADQVKVGDLLELHDGGQEKNVPVAEIECANFKGLYNPATTHGDMIVDGIKVSTYTKAVQSGIAHSLLAPLRAVYRWFGWSLRSLERGAPRIVKLLP